MGLVEHQLGNYQEAVKLYKTAIDIVVKEFGKNHYKVVKSMLIADHTGRNVLK